MCAKNQLNTSPQVPRMGCNSLRRRQRLETRDEDGGGGRGGGRRSRRGRQRQQHQQLRMTSELRTATEREREKEARFQVFGCLPSVRPSERALVRPISLFFPSTFPHPMSAVKYHTLRQDEDGRTVQACKGKKGRGDPSEEER